MNSPNLAALFGDSGAALDVLDAIVNAYDNGRLKDCVVKHEGAQVWLIDELARAIVEQQEVVS